MRGRGSGDTCKAASKHREQPAGSPQDEAGWATCRGHLSSGSGSKVPSSLSGKSDTTSYIEASKVWSLSPSHICLHSFLC